MIGKVPWGVAGTGPLLVIGFFVFTEIPALGAEAQPEFPCSVTAPGDVTQP